MAKLEILCLHVTATPYGRKVTPDDLIFWHLFPCKNADGTYTYKGKKYKTVSQIPDDSYKINGKILRVRNYPNNGRGWSQVGYADFIDNDGVLHNLVPYNYDNVVDAWEITNGASGINSKARHVCCAGGGSKLDPNKQNAIMPVTEVLNEKQIETLVKYCKFQKEMLPSIRIAGHNEFASKTCPNFDVKKFVKDYEI